MVAIAPGDGSLARSRARPKVRPLGRYLMRLLAGAALLPRETRPMLPRPGTTDRPTVQTGGYARLRAVGRRARVERRRVAAHRPDDTRARRPSARPATTRCR